MLNRCRGRRAPVRAGHSNQGRESTDSSGQLDNRPWSTSATKLRTGVKDSNMVAITDPLPASVCVPTGLVSSHLRGEFRVCEPKRNGPSMDPTLPQVERSTQLTVDTAKRGAQLVKDTLKVRLLITICHMSCEPFISRARLASNFRFATIRQDPAKRRGSLPTGRLPITNPHPNLPIRPFLVTYLVRLPTTGLLGRLQDFTRRENVLAEA